MLLANFVSVTRRDARKMRDHDRVLYAKCGWRDDVSILKLEKIVWLPSRTIFDPSIREEEPWPLNAHRYAKLENKDFRVNAVHR